MIIPNKTIYLQHILKPLITNDEKNPDEIYEEHLKLDGYTLGQEEYIKDLIWEYLNDWKESIFDLSRHYRIKKQKNDRRQKLYDKEAQNEI